MPNTDLIVSTLTILLLQNCAVTMMINCTDIPCTSGTYICSDEICQINCNAVSSCSETQFICDDSYLHSICKIICNGDYGCYKMSVESHRDTIIECNGDNSCDEMNIQIYGDNHTDKITANITSMGSGTDNLHLECHGDGIEECFMDCKDNGEYYSCMGVSFDCHTPGICRFKCENSNACCGCVAVSALLVPVTFMNKFNCYYEQDHCIQVS